MFFKFDFFCTSRFVGGEGGEGGKSADFARGQIFFDAAFVSAIITRD